MFNEKFFNEKFLLMVNINNNKTCICACTCMCHRSRLRESVATRTNSLDTITAFHTSWLYRTFMEIQSNLRRKKLYEQT